MDTLSDLVTRFYGRDPILGEDACLELLSHRGEDAIEALVPLNADVFRYSYQVELRLKYVASILGDQIVPHLVQVILAGPWDSKLAAAVCFSGLKDSVETEKPLIEILKAGANFDAERMAVESLGRLGAYHWAHDLERYARTGQWAHGSDRILDYPFEKLSSYVLDAFTRFTTLASEPDRADTLFRDLTKLIELKESRLPNRSPNSYELVLQLSDEFAEWSVDPIIKHWGSNANERLQRLAFDLLRDIAQISAAEFLLETAIDPARSDSVRRSASIALGELRVPEVAQLVADALRDSAIDRTHLDWAFSTLYAVPADWSGLSGYVDELLKRDDQQSFQLRYSLALKKDNRCLNDLIRYLDDAEPFKRWTSALALARLLGPKAAGYLAQRAENAEHEGERCALYAAMIRAGDREKVSALHSALEGMSSVSTLFSVWKLEIIDAFRAGDKFDERAFSLWRDASRIGTRQLQYFEALVPLQLGAIRSTVVLDEIPRAPERTKIFVSYSHEDQRWLFRLQVHLKPLQQSNKITLWDDTMIKSGEKWREVIKRALEETKVAVLLISADFLASDFINTVELPALLEAAASEGVLIIPVLVSPSRFELTASLVQFQSPNLPSQPLNSMKKSKQEEVFVKVSEVVEQAFRP